MSLECKACGASGETADVTTVALYGEIGDSVVMKPTDFGIDAGDGISLCRQCRFMVNRAINVAIKAEMYNAQSAAKMRKAAQTEAIDDKLTELSANRINTPTEPTNA